MARQAARCRPIVPAMSPRHARAFAMHTRPSPRSISLRLRQTDRRNRVSGVAWATSALHSERDRADVGPHPPGPGMFIAGRRRREFCESSHVRTHAQSCAKIGSSRARVPYMDMAGCEFSPATAMRTGAHPKYPTRYPPAYAHSRSNGGTSFSYVGDEVHRAMHRPITRPQIPARGDGRIPAESQSAPSAQSLPGVLITIVSRPHAPSIIAPWQGSGRRSVSGQPLRHDGDRRKA